MTASAAPSRSTTVSRVLLTGALAAVLTSAVNVAIGWGAVAVGVPQTPVLGIPAGVSASAVAGMGGAIGWQLVRARAADPRKVLVLLVPIVLLLSFIPDIVLAVLIADTTGIAPVLALALMHVATITIAVAVYARLLPVGAVRTKSARVPAEATA
ncbi:hypothetical protein [Naasia aerilata]|uniref:ECF transporter S component n=1 Tax=Naasia aerilata TaxID=1162966 RepID=A0ABN6XJ37_9MICO|nr:hypothetical protein [Naasia aerilata]BDZ44840.1 hypothetical protein GCM10025866_07490 [Naasia aerilata]